MSTQISRPFGVTLLAVLEVVGGILGIGGGLFLIGVSGLMMFRIRLEILLLAVGISLTIIGAVQLFLAYGLWNAKSWAWTWALIFSILGAVFAIVSIARGHAWNILRLIVDGVIIYYLNTPHVKAFFGKAPATQPQT